MQKIIEGEIMTGRSYGLIEREMGIAFEKVLKEKLILNAGCGNSSLSLQSDKLNAHIIDMDINWPDEIGKNFVQCDLRNIVFKDQYFDITLSSWVIYQIDDRESKKRVIKEMIRCTKYLVAIVPIWGYDFEILQEVLKDEPDWEILISCSINSSSKVFNCFDEILQSSGFQISSPKGYDYNLIQHKFGTVIPKDGSNRVLIRRKSSPTSLTHNEH